MIFKINYINIHGAIPGTYSNDNVPVESISSDAVAKSINLVCDASGPQGRRRSTYYSHFKEPNKEYENVLNNVIRDFPPHRDTYTKLVNVC